MQKLATTLNYYWRLFATGFAFSLFGFAGIVLAPIVVLGVRLAGGGEAVVRRRCQRMVSLWFSTFSHVMRLTGLIDWTIEGAERLQAPGQLIIANHPTLIDVVLLIGYLPKVDCIVKQALFENPFTHVPVSSAGYVSNAPPARMVSRCVELLRQGRSLMVFPEGTRTVPGRPIRVDHASARIALESGAPVLPVIITCEPITLSKGSPWYHIPPRRARFTLRVGEPESTAAFLDEAPSLTIAARRLSRHWEAQFSTALGLEARA